LDERKREANQVAELSEEKKDLSPQLALTKTKGKKIWSGKAAATGPGSQSIHDTKY
jgi:hypothetical protein